MAKNEADSLFSVWFVLQVPAPDLKRVQECVEGVWHPIGSLNPQRGMTSLSPPFAFHLAALHLFMQLSCALSLSVTCKSINKYVHTVFSRVSSLIPPPSMAFLTVWCS